MAVTVNKIEYDNFFWSRKGNTFTLLQTASATITCKKDKKVKKYKFTFQAGFKCDGLSVPKAFQWFLPRWDDNNMTYNLAGVIHDALYGNKGFKTFTRDESDAIFRGILRESGQSRFKASTADFALGIAACRHWGDDSLNCAKLATMQEIA